MIYQDRRNNMNQKKKTPAATSEQSPMIKPREIIPIMAQSADPLGSYTGTAAGGNLENKAPTQDADDL
jgi:hypothetical protein